MENRKTNCLFHSNSRFRGMSP